MDNEMIGRKKEIIELNRLYPKRLKHGLMRLYF